VTATKWIGRLAVALVLLTVTGGAAQDQQRPGPYIDPLLQALTEPAVRQSLEAASRPGLEVPAQALPFGGRIALSRLNAAAPVRVNVFVKLSTAQGLAELNALGGAIGSVRNDIATVELPLSALDQLPRLRFVRQIEAAHTVTITDDSAARSIRVNDVRSVASGIWTGATGTGVIVGIFDTGIDIRHDDFRRTDGQTRLLGLWDQTNTASGSTPPAGFRVGHYCSREAIQRVIDTPTDPSSCSQVDISGHGSHTAGTAAGDGSGNQLGPSTYQYAGVAPMADLLIVKGGNGSFLETNIIDGLRWLEEQSRALGRPMVVNLSLGTPIGPHDGSRIYEQEIDNLSRPGFIIVVSAGNEGSNGNIRNANGTPFTFAPVYIHGSGQAATGATREFTFDIPTYNRLAGACNDYVVFSLWYEAQDRLSITLIRPNGSSATGETGLLVVQDDTTGNIRISNAPSGPNPSNNANEATVQADDCGSSLSAPRAGTWRLRVSTVGAGSGRSYHFWMIGNSLGGGTIARGRAGFDNRYVVGSPGNARSAVTVGAYATRMCWPSGTQQTCFPQVEEIGDLARFSSGGPTRDGRLKPEIVAPGMAIVSVLSRNATIAANRITPDLSHYANQGTSMAAPHVTGAIALLLEKQPMLTSAEVKEIFSRSAKRDAFTGRVYGNDAGAQPADWWGYGKLEVPRALCQLGALNSFISVSPNSDTLPQNATLRLEACASGASGAITFESTAPGIATVDALGIVRALQPGRALVIVRAGTNTDTASINVVPPATLVATGGSVAPGASTLGKRGTVLNLLALGLRVNGFENMNVESLSFAVTGTDAGARIVLAQDLNLNSRVDPADRLLAAVTRGSASADTLRVPTPAFAIAQRDSVRVLVGVELSGAARNQTAFQIRFIASETRTLGARSGARDRIEPVTGSIASAPASTVVLTANEVFALSENPVRSNRVVFNFAERPRMASIFTLTGRRVVDLAQRIDQEGSVLWDLRNEEGTRVAPGVYLVVFDMRGRIVREKLFVLTPRQ
jgi:subtilisin family serine protease